MMRGHALPGTSGSAAYQDAIMPRLTPLRLVSICVLVGLVVTPAGAGAAKATLPDLDKAAWVWASPKALRDGVFGCYFRKTLGLPAKPTHATLLVTADNGYDLFVNGSLVGGDAGYGAEYWRSVEKYDIATLLAPGRNVIGVKGQNMGGPAGLVVAVRIELPDGSAIELHSDKAWRTWLLPETGWSQADFDDSKWRPAAELGRMGIAPWGRLTYPGPVSPRQATGRPAGRFVEGGPQFRWPAGIVFLRGLVPHSTTRGSPQSIWRIRGSRAYLEHDAPAPSVLGRQLWTLVPAKPGGRLRQLHDAGKGIIGSPSVSYDGKSILFTMAPAGEKFLHICRIGADGSGLRELTKGPFHDYDPAPLPDGGIVFSSTRIGSREEYHGNLASSLFVMNADGSSIRPLTHHIVADREPKVTAGGSIVFVRSDNFLERAKVETQIHHVRPDGTGGTVVLGADRGAIGYDPPRAAERNSNWLRRFGFGSPAPLPDGRVAAISSHGLVVSGAVASGEAAVERVPAAAPLFDIAPMPDGRLLCTVAGHGAIGVLDPATGNIVRIHATDTYDLHSVACLGPRPKPPTIAPQVRAAEDTGFLLCQSVFYTKQTQADRSRIKAIRVYEGRPLALRSARHPYDHIGVESVELGTVPLAPDGSFYVRVPADRALALQAVDAEGRGVINEVTWIYARPGERRTCVGCHSQRPSAPSLTADALAARFEPLSLTGQGRPHRYRGNNAANGGVLNLQFDRFRETAAINLYPQPPLDPATADKPLPPGRPTEVRRLCRQLASGSADLKLSAARRLAIFRDRAATPALAAALADQSPEVRTATALGLAACGNRDAVPPLLNALTDGHPIVAQAANAALEHLTGHAAGFDAFVPGGREAGAKTWRAWVRAHNWERGQSPQGRGTVPLATIEAGLIAELADTSPSTVHKAIEALGHVGGDAGKAALREWLRSEPSRLPLTAIQERGQSPQGRGTVPFPAPLRMRMAAMRALGHLRDRGAVPLLAEVLNANIRKNPGRPPHLHELGWLQRPVYLAATAAEALGWIGTPEAEKALIDAYPRLLQFWQYTFWTGDHSWLMGCHSSVVHFRIAEALDAMGSRDLRPIIPHILRSVPLDTDRGLLLENDAYETLVARIVQRSGLAPAVLETCLAVLGDKAAKPVEALKAGVTASPPASSCKPLCPEARAAQIASVVCLDTRQAARLRAAFDRYRATPPSRKRSWTCFFLARSLGKVRDGGSAPSLLAALEKDPTEVSFGLEDPPNVFVYKAMTPFYRAAAAYALGQIGDHKAVPALLRAVANFDNALDVRHAAAQALGMLRDPATLPQLRTLAATYPEVATRRLLLEACGRTTEPGG